MCIYIYIYDTCMIHIPLSLSIYLYIYIYIFLPLLFVVYPMDTSDLIKPYDRFEVFGVERQTHAISICLHSMKMPLDCCRRLMRPAGSYRTMHSKVHWSSKKMRPCQTAAPCQTIVSVAFCTGVQHTVLQSFRGYFRRAGVSCNPKLFPVHCFFQATSFGFPGSC